MLIKNGVLIARSEMLAQEEKRRVIGIIVKHIMQCIKRSTIAIMQRVDVS